MVLTPVPSTGFAAAPPLRTTELLPKARFGLDRRRDWQFYVGRGALGLGIAAAHGLLLWLALLLSGVAAPPRLRDDTLTAVDISQVEKPDAPAKPAAQVVVPVKPQIVLPSPLTIAAPAQASGSGTGQGCNMAMVVGKSISESPEAMAAVAALPQRVRSDTDAVMLWNGAWLDTGQAPGLSLVPGLPALLGQDPVSTIKTVILAAITAAPPECQGVETLGPQLIPVAEAGRTTMLVIGSGAWRWATLLEPEPIPAALPGAAQPAAVPATAPAAN